MHSLFVFFWNSCLEVSNAYLLEKKWPYAATPNIKDDQE